MNLHYDLLDFYGTDSLTIRLPSFLVTVINVQDGFLNLGNIDQSRLGNLRLEDWATQAQ